MEKRRCINQMHWVFDLPDATGMDVQGNEPTRVMMIYDRATNVTQFEILDKRLSKHAREHISWWLRNNRDLNDTVNGMV